jgi:hypothetical protein
VIKSMGESPVVVIHKFGLFYYRFKNQNVLKVYPGYYIQ